MSKIITESGMGFGPFDEEYLYEIEKSDLVKKKKIKIVEFVTYFENKKKEKYIVFIEAKTSSPILDYTSKDKKEKFDKYIEELYQKFVNSVSIFFSINLERYDDYMGSKLKNVDLSTTDVKLVLVIKNYKEEWLIDINHLVKQKFHNLSQTCNIKDKNIMVINEIIARDKKIICS